MKRHKFKPGDILVCVKDSDISRFCKVGDLVEVKDVNSYGMLFVTCCYREGDTVLQWVELNRLMKIGEL